MGCGSSFVKYVLFFFNLLFSLVGLAMVGIGIAVLYEWSPVVKVVKDNLTVAPWLFIIIGAVVFVIAFFGCCGAIRESHCMIVTYAIFLLVIIIVQVILAVLMFVYGDNIEEALRKSTTKLYENSKTDAPSREIFNNIEQQLQCCGNEGPSDYGLSLPASCCYTNDPGLVSKALAGSCTYLNAHQQGCNPLIRSNYQTWNKTIAGFAIGVACIEVVGALFALCLANSIRNMDRRYA